MRVAFLRPARTLPRIPAPLRRNGRPMLTGGGASPPSAPRGPAVVLRIQDVPGTRRLIIEHSISVLDDRPVSHETLGCQRRSPQA